MEIERKGELIVYDRRRSQIIVFSVIRTDYKMASRCCFKPLKRDRRVPTMSVERANKSLVRRKPRRIFVSSKFCHHNVQFQSGQSRKFIWLS